MKKNSRDLFALFIENYEAERYLEAFRLILPNPNINYDHLHSNYPQFKYLVNYTDATVYQTILEVIDANEAIQIVFREEGQESHFTQQFLNLILWEYSFLKVYLHAAPLDRDRNLEQPIENQQLLEKIIHIKDASTIEEDDIQQILSLIPSHHRTHIHQFLTILKHWKSLKVNKPHLQEIFNKKFSDFYKIPWHTFSYQLEANSFPHLNSDQIPIIFLEPLEGIRYHTLLSDINQRPAIFVFETISHLLQLLQFSDVLEILSHPQHFIYFLDIYPQEQFSLQHIPKVSTHQLRPFFITERTLIQDTIPLFMKAFVECSNQKKEDFQIDTSASDWLYHICKQLLFQIESEKYGSSRHLALLIKNGFDRWFDDHKGHPDPKYDVDPIATDPFYHQLQELNDQRQPREMKPKNKLRLAHIVPQISGIQHAPTRLLYNLIHYADHSWFDLFLISTERLLKRSLDYPFHSEYISVPSLHHQNLLEYFNGIGTKIHIESNFSTYEQTAHSIARLLKNLDIDIAVFHGPDEINCLISNLSDVPIRVLFEHGTPPIYPSFDLAILSTEDTWLQHQKEYRQMGMESCALNFCINVKIAWPTDPLTKEELGFPSDSFIMTTISNHLDHRLSAEMCQAIGEILQKHPHVYYAPMGKIIDSNKFMNIFNTYGVQKRVKFLGSQAIPSHYARSMHLYLNEFPFGSCLGMLDAMAAGCPVVSMYDENGPPQAKYAANYFGKDRVIKTGRKEDYVALASQLIENPSMYEEWSEHAKKQYAKQSDELVYVKSFEKILEAFIDYHLLRKNQTL